MTGTTIRSAGQHRAHHFTLNSDGKQHKLLNAVSLLTLVLGLFSFALGLFIRTGPSGLHTWAIVGGVTGLAALVVGLGAQMMSATREERIVIVTGIVAAFVGLALGLSHGGFS